MKNIKVLSVFVVVFGFSFGAEARKLIYVKHDGRAAQGACLPDLKEKPSKVLKRNNIRVYTLNAKGKKSPLPSRDLDARSHALAELIATIENTGDGRFDAYKGEDVFFGGAGRSRATSKGIIISSAPGNYSALKTSPIKNFSGQTNKALMATMLGYRVAHKNNHLNKYQEAGGLGCKVSHYAKKDIQTEFSQVFAAYLTNPALLNKKSCKKALKFMKELFGETDTPKNCKKIKKLRTDTNISRLIKKEKDLYNKINKKEPTIKDIINKDQRDQDNKKIDKIIQKDLRKQERIKRTQELLDEQNKNYVPGAEGLY